LKISTIKLNNKKLYKYIKNAVNDIIDYQKKSKKNIQKFENFIA